MQNMILTFSECKPYIKRFQKDLYIQFEMIKNTEKQTDKCTHKHPGGDNNVDLKACVF